MAAENPTHLETHTGLTHRFRIQATPPTDPVVETGEVYIDNTVGGEAIGIYGASGWLFISLQI